MCTVFASEPEMLMQLWSKSYYNGTEKGFRTEQEHIQKRENSNTQTREDTAGDRQTIQKEQLRENSAKLTYANSLVVTGIVD